MTTGALRKPQRAATESSWKATACLLPTGPGPALRHCGLVVLHGKGWTGGSGWRGALPGGVTLRDPAVRPGGWLNTPDFNLRFLPSSVVENGPDRQLDPL